MFKMFSSKLRTMHDVHHCVTSCTKSLSSSLAYRRQSQQLCKLSSQDLPHVLRLPTAANGYSMVSVYSRGIRTASESHADSKLDAEKVEKKVVDKGDLVYIGTMARLVRFVKIFSISTSLMGISVQPLIYNQVADLHWALALMVGSVASFFVFVTPVLLHIITKRYVTRMYWDSETNKFSATTYSLFLRELEHNFIAEQVVVPSTPGIFTTILVNGGKTPLFLDPSLFVDKRALIHLLRYNEPLDWEIPPTLSRPNERSNDAARSAAQTKTDTKH